MSLAKNFLHNKFYYLFKCNINTWYNKENQTKLTNQVFRTNFSTHDELLNLLEIWEKEKLNLTEKHTRFSQNFMLAHTSRIIYSKSKQSSSSSDSKNDESHDDSTIPSKTPLKHLRKVNRKITYLAQLRLTINARMKSH